MREQIDRPGHFVTSRKRDATQHGTGLGLAIARQIIERHNGTITATTLDPNTKITGTTFTITLPPILKRTRCRPHSPCQSVNKHLSLSVL